MTETWTILKMLQWMAGYFSERGIENARLDVELLLSFALDLERVQLYTQFDRPLTVDELKKIKDLVKRRAEREPLAYIRGLKEFYSMEFVVAPAVLIPRPETEMLVEEGIKLAQNPPNPPLTKGGKGGFQILDVGTGSCCIAIALAKNLSAAHVWAADVSSDALEIARTNVKKHGVEDRVTLLLWDLHKDPWNPPPDRFDLIVSNPPYVSSGQLSKLAPEISYEPRTALDGGPEGLDFYPPLLDFARFHLEPQGWLLAEIGEEQGDVLLQLCREKGFAEAQILKDLSGKSRVLRAR
jgi:release factor glutamine methyltransferase